ncbi:MAG: pyridoxal kinase PdxY [Hyphomicrobiales bacterium]
MPILSIQSHVVYGHVGNAAAVFPLQRMGFEVWPLHTVQFAAHTGYGPPKGRVFDAAMIDEVMEGLAARPDFSTCEAVLSGYLGSVESAGAVLRAVERVKRANAEALYCCDPVMGDEGKGFYVKPDMPDFIREHIAPRADILTPNLFELEALTGLRARSHSEIKTAIQKIHTMGPRIVLVTSAITDDTPSDHFDMIVSDGLLIYRLRTPRLDLVPNGAGDLTASLFLGRYLVDHDVAKALSHAASSVYGVLKKTKSLNAPELALIAAQDEFKSPSQIFLPEVL